jgi:DeoR family glycerol-3-phosphate regulon repressor
VNTNPRQLLLLEQVRERKSATVEQLAETLGVTLQTVRRDVQRLAEIGLLTRFHGGVRVPSSTVENLAHPQRETLNAEGKARIARAVAQQVPNDCSLILNIGTTTEAIAKALLHHRGLRVITNNLNVAAILSGNPDCEVIVAGGATGASWARPRWISSASSRSTLRSSAFRASSLMARCATSITGR